MAATLSTATTTSAELAVERSTCAALTVTDTSATDAPTRETSTSAELVVTAHVTVRHHVSPSTLTLFTLTPPRDEYLLSVADSAARATLSAVLSRTRPPVHDSPCTSVTSDAATRALGERVR